MVTVNILENPDYLKDLYTSIPDLTAILIVSLLLIITCGIILIWSIYKNFNLVPSTEPPVILDPGAVGCNPDDVLQAYILGYPNKENCPAWTNNYVVDRDDYLLYEKSFIVTDNCCFFSNEIGYRAPVKLPWICVGNQTGEKYNVQELNEKPYLSDGITVKYITPPCRSARSSGIPDDSCMSLVLGSDRIDVGVYKILDFYGTTVQEPGIPDDTHRDLLALDFHVSTQCGDLLEVYYLTDRIGYLSSTGIWIWEVSNPPILATEIQKIFASGGFAPIAGANPPASAYAAGLISS